MAKRVTLFIVGIVLLIWTVIPDPVIGPIDDIITGITGAGILLSTIKKAL